MLILAMYAQIQIVYNVIIQILLYAKMVMGLVDLFAKLALKQLMVVQQAAAHAHQMDPL